MSPKMMIYRELIPFKFYKLMNLVGDSFGGLLTLFNNP